jgi:CDP-glucose 4,6-dehydratase
MQINQQFWRNKKVFITGHTGFKGSWLTLWLSSLGAKIYGYALEPNTDPNLFNIWHLENKITHQIADIRDLEKLQKALNDFAPDIVFHLSAQPLVRYSYHNPIETYQTNVMGTVNLLEAVRNYGKASATIIITSDKCYENVEKIVGYQENDKMGGHDPYSNSKGCAELVVSAYANSYFIPNPQIGKVASVRAGNVIGGGDWSQDRLIPDLIKNLVAKKNPVIRNPKAIRPWQNVIEPLYGYLLVAQHLCELPQQKTLLNWNFGPDLIDQKNVEYVAKMVAEIWGGDNKIEIAEDKNKLHEANLLYLNCDKAKKELDWHPKWHIEDSIKNTVEWYKIFYNKSNNILEYSLKIIEDFDKKC